MTTNAINITNSNTIDTNRTFNKYRIIYGDIPFVTFDEIAAIEQRGWTVVALQELGAIDMAMRQTRNTGVWGWYPRKNFAFIVDHKGCGYAAKAERGESCGEEHFRGGSKSKKYEYFVKIIPVIDIANIGFAVLQQVRRQRGGDGNGHVADGYWLKNIVEAPDEFLEDIKEVQPVEAHALRELRQIRRDFKSAFAKATYELRELTRTDETIPVRTFRFNTKIEVTHFDLNYFKVVDDEGDEDTWSSKTICLETNILDII